MLYLLGISVLLQSAFCGKRCDDYTVSPIRGPIEEYFGVYKPGNWWVYQNKDGTKRDSIYITDYSDVVSRNRTTCLESEERRFAIKNTFFFNAADIYITYQSHETGIAVNFSTSSGQTQSGPLPQFIYQFTDSAFYSFPSSNNQGSNRAGSITLNGQIYQDILIGRYGSDIFYYAKNRGLVGWTANNETFNLTRYKIL